MKKSESEKDNDTSINAITCYQPRTEQTAFKGVQMIPTDQSQDTHGCTTILTDDLLWEYTVFTDYVPTAEHSNANVDQI